MLVPEKELENLKSQKENQQGRRESWTSIVSSRRNSRVMQNDLLLHEAVIKNEPEAVEKILREPVDVNSRNNYGRAPIHWASSRGSTEIMKMLMKAKCDIEAQDKFGMRPLLMAASHGHKDATELLVKSGATVSAINKKQYTVLICAAKNNRVDVINFLMETLKDVKVNEADFEKKTALHHAAAGGHIQSVRKLIEMKAIIDCVDKDLRTPLHAAAEKGHVEVVEFLLQKNADADAKDKNGSAPLHLSAQNRQTRVTQVLLEHESNPDSADEKGLTALHVSSDLGCRGIVDLLIKHGSNINSQSKTGNTPLHLACRSNELEIVQALISNGADVNVFNVRLETPIHVAAENGYKDICKALLAAGANIHHKEQEEKTSLYAAARGSFIAVMDMIIKTAELDYRSPEDDHAVEFKGNVKKKMGKMGNRGQPNCNRISSQDYNERLRNIFYKIAFKQLADGEWKQLALYWSFTQDEIQAIEDQYTGSSAYKEHGFRIMLIWAHGLGQNINPVKELHNSLLALGIKKAADALRKNVTRENNDSFRVKRRTLRTCLIL